MHNVGVRFGKVIIANLLITCTCKGYNNNIIMVLVNRTYAGSFTWYEFCELMHTY